MWKTTASVTRTTPPKALLGTDGAVLGTADLVALGCTRCRSCERGRGHPFGLTTTDPELSLLVDPDQGAAHIGNRYNVLAERLREILRRLACAACGNSGTGRICCGMHEGNHAAGMASWWLNAIMMAGG